MRIDCHTHTGRYSSCSSLEPEELCQLALHQNLDAIVITEHHVQWQPSEISDLAGQFPQLRIYAGMEVTLREGYDVVVIGKELRDVGKRLISIAELTTALEDRRDEVFLFIAHPFRFSKRYGSRIQHVLDAVDGIEMNSVNILRAQHRRIGRRYTPDDDALYLQANKGRDLTRLYNTDAHTPNAVGTIMNEFEAPPPEDETALARLLASHQPCEMQDPELLKLCLDGYSY